MSQCLLLCFFVFSQIYIFHSFRLKCREEYIIFCRVVLAVENMFEFLYFACVFFLLFGFIFLGGGYGFIISALTAEKLTYFIIMCIKCTVCLQPSMECLSFLNLRNK